MKFIPLFLLFPLLLSAQTDTTDLTNGPRPLSAHERSIKSDLDAGLRKGADWRGLLKTVSYGSDCPDVFQYEYLVRLGLASAATPLEGDMNFFTKGCECGNRYLVQKGLEEGIDLNQYYTDHKETALMLAIKNKDLAGARLILAHPQNINRTTPRLRTALNYAAEYVGDTAFVAELLRRGANPTLATDWGYTALDAAWDNRPMFDHLFRHQMAFGDTAFWRKSYLVDIAIKLRDTAAMLRYLPLCDPWRTPTKNWRYLVAAASAEDIGNPSMWWAYDSSQCQDIRTFRVLKRYGYDLNATDSLGRNILFERLENDSLTTLLLMAGVKPNQKNRRGKTVLDLYLDRISKGNILHTHDDYEQALRMLRLYEKFGAQLGDASQNPWCALYLMCAERDNKAFRRYLRKHAAQSLGRCGALTQVKAIGSISNNFGKRVRNKCFIWWPFPRRPLLPLPYTDWKKLAQKHVLREYKSVIKYYPKTGGIPNIKPYSELEMVNSIAIDSNLMEIDSIVKTYGLDTSQNYRVVIRHRFSSGFNQWVVEEFLVQRGKEWVGVHLSRASPGGVMEARREPIVRRVIAYEADFLKPTKPRSGRFGSNDYMSATTVIDRKRNIVLFELSLYP